MSHNTMRTPGGFLFRSNHETYDEGDSVELTDPEGTKITMPAQEAVAFARWLVQYDGCVKIRDLE